MPSRDAKECNRGPLGLTSTLLPIPQRVHADPHRLGEARLRETDELPQRRDVLPGLESARDQSLPNASRDRARSSCSCLPARRCSFSR